ncbi:acyl-CoA dehydrogenase family protein [Emcibacter nanhaiensis]|uniref:Acyl-CoA dehydrogenase n=1 Tax=Emcibacter nanhaiensis TaxID=1505037 RepID=A0A501PRQ6_9PROT|nr:acyl-CoA dehydrogenase family protein [Emcibacter nanhaiensis]TPD63210.1 acyl-CoA dehydrogenase [Emcibacter nanhaiensis]
MSASSFADVAYDEAVQRTRDLVPVLRERAERSAKERIVLPETLDAFHRSGVLRALQPKRYGGMELDFTSVFDIGFEMGRGCASTSWTLVNLMIHHWMLALYDDKAQEDIWGDNPDAGIASGVIPSQGQATPVDGGYEVSGYWNFSSGVHVSDWNMLATTVRDGDKVVDLRLVLLHKSQYEVIDDWQVIGMEATGSMSVKAEKVFVPEHRALSMYQLGGGDVAPGTKVNTSPLYKVALSMLSGHVIGSAIAGNAQGALEMTIDSIKQRSAVTTGAKLRDIQAVQMRIGKAGAKIDAGVNIIRHDMLEGQDIARAGGVPDQERKLRSKRNVSFGAGLFREAVDEVFTLAGANAIYHRYPIQRMFRDTYAGSSHILFSPDINYSTWGLLALGGVVNNPTL